ncbi:MAG TPA: Dabb family protein [Planctomycetota bacterium]|nr:Dabb family protein [Planctomycetota bacterium]
MLLHNVYFTLSNPTEEACEALVEACRKYLKDHPGIVFFAAGRLEPELARSVNDRDFHIALHIAFSDREAHDRYQSAPDHKRFIEECSPGWARVRVFDSICSS